MIDELSNLRETVDKLQKRTDSLEARVASMDLKQSLGSRRPQEFTDITCADCGKTDRINFKPRYPGKLYCRTCFEKHRSEKR